MNSALAGPASAVCSHFGSCGGCASQDRPYAAQLADKAERVRRAVAEPGEVRPILPSPDVFFYRNKMEFAFGGLLGAPARLGLREKGKFDRVVDLHDCRLLSPETPRLLAALRGWADAERLPTYHLKSHRGFLRYAVVREGKNTGQRLLHLVTAPGDLPAASLLRAVEDSGARMDTVVWSVNGGLSDVARGGETKVLSGAGTIEETLDGLAFRISPTTFFQTNTRGAEILYRIVREMVGEAGVLFDVYCGSGTIGLFCAPRARRVVGVELHAPSVEDARANARAQGAANAEFHALDAAALGDSPDLSAAWSSPDAAAVFDPPRVGLAPKVRRLLLERPVRRWVYVSCNPDSLANDLALLGGAYRPAVVQPVDMFPHTPHVETVVLLERRA